MWVFHIFSEKVVDIKLNVAYSILYTGKVVEVTDDTKKTIYLTQLGEKR